MSDEKKLVVHSHDPHEHHSHRDHPGHDEHGAHDHHSARVDDHDGHQHAEEHEHDGHPDSHNQVQQISMRHLDASQDDELNRLRNEVQQLRSILSQTSQQPTSYGVQVPFGPPSHLPHHHPMLSEAHHQQAMMESHMLAHAQQPMIKPTDAYKYGSGYKPVQIVPPNSRGRGPCNCDICGRRCPSRSAYMIHVRMHTGEKPFECKDCGKKFASRGNLRSHVYKKHTEEKKYHCMVENCHERFKTRTLLQVHMEDKHDHPRQGFQCHACKKRFFSKHRLRDHLKGPRNADAWKCPICSREFKCRASLHDHKKLHGDKPYKCGECGTGFRTLTLLKIHQNIHLGIKPFKCEICGKGFAQSGSRNEHMRIHTGEKPYQCKVCRKRFRQTGQLSTHMRTHKSTLELSTHDDHAENAFGMDQIGLMQPEEEHRPHKRSKTSHASLPMLPAEFNLEQLFAHLGIHEHYSRFEKEGIDVHVLADLSDEDLKALIPKLGPRRKLQRFIKEHAQTLLQLGDQHIQLQRPMSHQALIAMVPPAALPSSLGHN